jgi:Bacterial regulatory protein, arsR family
MLRTMLREPPDGLPGWSPKLLSDELGMRLAKVSHHMRRLHETGLVRPVGTRPRRGAQEHFFELACRAP